jgi:dihydrofolate reductase
MRSLKVFNNISLDGFIADAEGNMGWAHRQDPEWLAFAAENARGEGAFLFGRVTYEMMASYWPTPAARQALPAVAERMNASQKLLVSRTLDSAAWQNTRLIKGDLVGAVRQLKQEAGPDLLIMGSGSIVAQLSQARLIDAYQVVVQPVVLGGGKSMFAGMKDKLQLRLEKSRQFSNGNVVLWYTPQA